MYNMHLCLLLVLMHVLKLDEGPRRYTPGSCLHQPEWSLLTLTALQWFCSLHQPTLHQIKSHDEVDVKRNKIDIVNHESMGMLTKKMKNPRKLTCKSNTNKIQNDGC